MGRAASTQLSVTDVRAAMPFVSKKQGVDMQGRVAAPHSRGSHCRLQRTGEPNGRSMLRALCIVRHLAVATTASR